MDKQIPTTLAFIAPKKVDEILSFTKNILSQLLMYTTLSSAEQRKVKLIVVEFVTNAIKHDTDDIARIILVIADNELSIQKLQHGLPINFNCKHDQFPFKKHGKTVDITFSNENKHRILIQDNYKFQFLDVERESLEMKEIPEHFGFYIITSTSNCFTYEFEPTTGLNRYVSQLSLGI